MTTCEHGNGAFEPKLYLQDTVLQVLKSRCDPLVANQLPRLMVDGAY